MEKIKGRYDIVDCEHSGDIQRDIDYVRSLGCEVIGHYWDGHDCGDAYVEFYCTPELVVKHYKDTCFHFDCDITKYINFRETAIKVLKNKYNVVDSAEYEETKHRLSSNVSEGFKRTMPIELIFKMESYGMYRNPVTKISSFRCHIGGSIKFERVKVEGDTYSILMTTDFSEIRSGIVELIKSSFWSWDGLISVKPIHNIYKLFGEVRDADSCVAFNSLVFTISDRLYDLRFVNDNGDVKEVDVEDFIPNDTLIDFNYNGYHLDINDPVVYDEDC